MPRQPQPRDRPQPQDRPQPEGRSQAPYRSQARPGDHARRSSRRGAPDARRVRLLALAAVVVCAALLPLAVASAGQVGDHGDVAAGGAGAPAGPVVGRPGGGGSPAVRAGDASGVAAGRADGRGGVPTGPGGAPEDVASDWTGGRERGPARSAVRTLPGADDKMPAVPSPSPLLLGLGPATAVRCGPEVSAPDGVEAQTCVLHQGDQTWARTYYRNATGEPLDAALTLMGPDDHTVRTRCLPEGDDEPQTCETPREHTRGAPADYTAVAEFARPGGSGTLLLRAGSSTPDESGG